LVTKSDIDSKTSEKTFTSDFFSSLVKSLGTTLAIGIAGFVIQNFFVQRAQISIADLGPSGDQYSQLLIVDNYSLGALEDIQIGFQTRSLTIGAQSQSTVVKTEKASATEQSITIAKVLPLRRFSMIVTTEGPVDQSKIQKISGPIGVTYTRSDQLTSPIFSDLASYVVFLYTPMAVMLIFFSLRLRRTYRQISEDHKSVLSKGEDLRDQLDAVRANTHQKLAAIKKVYLLRMDRLSKENESWRAFLANVMKRTLSEDVNAKKILHMFLGSNGLLTERDLQELDEAELVLLMRDRETRELNS
jgi:hypothetical protein